MFLFYIYINLYIYKNLYIVTTIYKFLKIFSMASYNTKWSDKMTEQLISHKHSNEVVQKFENSINKPRKLKECWKEVGEIFDPAVTGEEVKTKYNQLLSKYKNIVSDMNRSGFATIKWKYLDLFRNTFPKSIKTNMNDVIELGSMVNATQMADTSQNSVENETSLVSKKKEYKRVISRC